MNKIQMEFNNLLGEMSDEQFWSWVSEWFDEQLIMDIMHDWDDDTKKDKIKNMKKILKEEN